jgi:hypothetical protein
MNVAVIIGSTCAGRVGEDVGKWVFEISQRRKDAQFELVDIADLCCTSTPASTSA